MQKLNLEQAHLARRAGLVLLAIGLVDVVFFLIDLAQSGRFDMSLNIAPWIAGVIVYRGHPDGIRLIVRVLSFGLGAVAALPLFLLVVPPRLVWLGLRLAEPSTLISLYWALIAIALLVWVRRRLGGLPLFGELRPAAPLLRSVSTWLGVGLAAVVLGLVSLFLRGETAQRAVASAREEMGPGYEYWVQELSTSDGAGRAVVLAYSEDEIVPVVVEW